MTYYTVNFDFPIREPQNAQELAILIETTITQIQERFEQMSGSIMTRINDMGQRIDKLECHAAHIVSTSNSELI